MIIKTMYLILIMLIVIISCQEMPNELSYDNPLDVQNHITHGDPFNLTANLIEGDVLLTWSEVHLEKVIGYNIYRSMHEPNDFSNINGQYKIVVLI